MTVAELIEKLKECDPTKPVMTPGDGWESDAGTWFEGYPEPIIYITETKRAVVLERN